MASFRAMARSGAVVVGVLLASALALHAPAQAPTSTPRPFKSVYGKLSAVDKSQNGVIMTSDSGQRLAWRFDPAVIAEAARFKPGDPLIVIYRQVAANEKRVTAIAFPGSATSQIYVNTTGAPVLLRSAPAVNGACGQPDAGPVTESTIPAGGAAEVLEKCWCCAASGESCTPGNESGLGRALLVQCFK
jgi:hypothetical protein